MITVLLIVLAVLIVMVGVAFPFMGFDIGLFAGIASVLVAILCVGLGWAVFATATGIHDYFGEDDPCVHVHTTGKVTWTSRDHGWQTTGGRPVWCGPGPVPGGEA